MSDNLTRGLIQVYQEKGQPLQYILNDPLFKALPADKQLEIVKSHAKELLAGSGKYSPSDNNIGWKIAGGTLGSGLAAGLTYFNGGPAMRPLLIPGTAAAMLVGGIGMAGLSLYDKRRNKLKFETTNKYLKKVVEGQNTSFYGVRALQERSANKEVATDMGLKYTPSVLKSTASIILQRLGESKD